MDEMHAFPTAHGHGNHGLQLKTLFTKFAAPKRMSGTNVYTELWARNPKRYRFRRRILFCVSSGAGTSPKDYERVMNSFHFTSTIASPCLVIVSRFAFFAVTSIRPLP